MRTCESCGARNGQADEVWATCPDCGRNLPPSVVEKEGPALTERPLGVTQLRIGDRVVDGAGSLLVIAARRYAWGMGDDVPVTIAYEDGIIVDYEPDTKLAVLVDEADPRREPRVWGMH